jgi:transcriptional regulator with AAA-type ATPase domain
VSPLIRRLQTLALAKNHLLINGPSGAGKELSARAYAALLNRDLIIHNSAAFATEEEAASTLFGVRPGVFTGVAEREGFIRKADGKALFLDEIHNLPDRLQKTGLTIQLYS